MNDLGESRWKSFEIENSESAYNLHTVSLHSFSSERRAEQSKFLSGSTLSLALSTLIMAQLFPSLLLLAVVCWFC